MLGERVGQERMPVAHADVDWQRLSGGGEARLRALGLRHGQLGDRRDAAERLVVMRDLLDAAGRDAAAAQDVLEEGTDVGRRLRTAEGNHQHGIEGMGHVLAADYTGLSALDFNPRSAIANRQSSRLPRPVWLLGWVSLFTDTATEMIYPLLPLFLTRVLGAGAMSLGVIEGVAEAANSALKVIAGRLADRTGAPKPIVIAGYTTLGAVRPLIGLVTSWTHVLAIRFADRLGKGIRSAPRDAMLAHFAPRRFAAASTASTARWTTRAPSWGRCWHRSSSFSFPSSIERSSP